MLADALEHLVQGIVSHPDDVRIRDRELRHGRMLGYGCTRRTSGR